MDQTPTLKRYGLVAQAFHWFVVLLMIGLFVTINVHLGTSDDSPLHMISIKLHISLGILLFLVTILRVGWRKLVPPPELPGAPKWSQMLANLMHVVLNLSTLLIPIFGYLRVVSHGYTANFFGYPLPSIMGESTWMSNLMGHYLHGEPMEVFILTLIVLHILAALWHQYVWKDNGLRRMLPW